MISPEDRKQKTISPLTHQNFDTFICMKSRVNHRIKIKPLWFIQNIFSKNGTKFHIRPYNQAYRQNQQRRFFRRHQKTALWRISSFS